MPLPPADWATDDARPPPVLVASDDHLMSGLLDALLSDAGFRVELFNSGGALLERLRPAAESCVVLLSLRWPPLTSQMVLTVVGLDRVLATRHAYILLTARHDMLCADEWDLLTQLAVPVVPKPFDIDVLVQSVATAAARLQSG